MFINLFRRFSSCLMFTCLCFSCFHAAAQSPTLMNASEILLRMKKLNVLGSVLYVAAHPDDENTRMLAWLSNEKLYRTAYLSLTRGDGGQNLIGDEQGDALGVIRTRELMAARKIDGAEQFFSTACDFGYSKNPEETFLKWDREQLLFEMVWMIRKFKPDVIICRFPTTGEGGHGQHTASAILTSEAFDFAADPDKFPEQLQAGLSIWQAKRLLWNTFNFGGLSTQKEDQFKINVGGFNPLLGKSYGEIAALSRSQHKSQGFGVPAQRGDNWEYLATIKGDTPRLSIMDGVNTTWQRTGIYLKGQPTTSSSIAAAVDSLVARYEPSHPEHSLVDLIQLYDLVSTSNDIYWKIQKQNEIKALIESAAGIYMEAITPKPYKTHGDSLQLMINFISQLGVDATITGVESELFGKGYKFEPFGKDSASVRFVISDNAMITHPYWLQLKRNTPGMFMVNNTDYIGLPEKKYSIQCTVRIMNHDFIFEKPVLYKYNDPVKGETYHPFVITPKVVLEPEQSLINMASSKSLKAIVHLKDMSFSTSNAHAEKKSIAIDLKKGINDINWMDDGKLYNRGYKKISYSHISEIFLFPEVQVNAIDVSKGKRKKIGYIAGAGDHVPEALRLLGYEVVMLGRDDIRYSVLKNLDALVAGVRCYNVNDWMDEVYDTLMNYIHNGGLMLVQYNTANNIGPLKSRIGPYPFKISRNRITDENAEVMISQVGLGIFNQPNKIAKSDFVNWVQERSIYHVTDADSRYIKPIVMHDPREKDDEGAMILAKYGKGTFIYTGLSLFRQLPAGVEGAYRLLENLLSK
jgi:LmbE family N-acetylglucosaminyl deacetylase